MTEQRLIDEARDTALTLVEGHGFYGAMNYVERAFHAGTDRGGFWLRVREQIIKLERKRYDIS